METPEMIYRHLGRCGMQVSVISLGGWTTFGGSLKDQTVTRSIIRRAVEAGVNFFDLADMYASGECEKVMGDHLREYPRHKLVISTKTFYPMSEDVNDRGLSRKHIFESIDKSLKRLGTDYVDIYFCHRFDRRTPLEETVRAMDDLVRAGKILYWGTSEWPAAQLRLASEMAASRNAYAPQVEQPQYNLIARDKFENETLPTADDLGMGLVVWSPLAAGFLTGKYDDAIPSDSRLSSISWLKDMLYKQDLIDRVKKMKALADELGCQRSHLALAWNLRHPQISSIITGATRVEQLDENLKALKVNLTQDMIQRLNELFPKGLVGIRDPREF